VKSFGKADEFYRARILSTSSDETTEFEWREDILYHKEDDGSVKTKSAYLIELVELDLNKKVTLRNLDNLNEAKILLATMQDDLNTLTKKEFDEKYLST
jgi:hypothetical protein